jgi:hypothetical protein
MSIARDYKVYPKLRLIKLGYKTVDDKLKRNTKKKLKAICQRLRRRVFKGVLNFLQKGNKNELS